MRSRTPKVLHDLCGRPMIAWPVAAALAAGAGKVIVIDGPQRPLEGQLPEGVELAIQPEPNGTGGAVQAAAALLGDETVLVLNGDVPLVTAEALAALLEAHAADGAQATVASMELDDPTGYGRVVRREDGSVARVVETKVAGDATEDELAIHEVNAGVYAFEGGPLKAGPRAPDPRQRPGRALPARRAGSAGPRRSALARRPDAAARRQRPRRSGPRARSGPGPHPRGPPARRGHDRRSRQHADRRRRRDRRRHRGRALLLPARRDDDRRALHRGPADHADRRHAGRRGAGAALLSGRVRGARRRERRALRLPAPRGPAARGRQGRHLRRDQELRHRRGHQGART